MTAQKDNTELNPGSGSRVELTVNRTAINEGGPCNCVIVNRDDDESQREWIKRIMCMHHWMQTDYYRAKIAKSASSSKR